MLNPMEGKVKAIPTDASIAGKRQIWRVLATHASPEKTETTDIPPAPPTQADIDKLAEIFGSDTAALMRSEAEIQARKEGKID
jgi:hypothetical protein